MPSKTNFKYFKKEETDDEDSRPKFEKAAYESIEQQTIRNLKSSYNPESSVKFHMELLHLLGTRVRNNIGDRLTYLQLQIQSPETLGGLKPNHCDHLHSAAIISKEDSFVFTAGSVFASDCDNFVVSMTERQKMTSGSVEKQNGYSAFLASKKLQRTAKLPIEGPFITQLQDSTTNTENQKSTIIKSGEPAYCLNKSIDTDDSKIASSCDRKTGLTKKTKKQEMKFENARKRYANAVPSTTQKMRMAASKVFDKLLVCNPPQDKSTKNGEKWNSVIIMAKKQVNRIKQAIIASDSVVVPSHAEQIVHKDLAEERCLKFKNSPKQDALCAVPVAQNMKRRIRKASDKLLLCRQSQNKSASNPEYRKVIIKTQKNQVRSPKNSNAGSITGFYRKSVPGKSEKLAEKQEHECKNGAGKQDTHTSEAPRIRVATSRADKLSKCREIENISPANSKKQIGVIKTAESRMHRRKGSIVPGGSVTGGVKKATHRKGAEKQEREIVSVKEQDMHTALLATRETQRAAKSQVKMSKSKQPRFATTVNSENQNGAVKTTKIEMYHRKNYVVTSSLAPTGCNSKTMLKKKAEKQKLEIENAKEQDVYAVHPTMQKLRQCTKQNKVSSPKQQEQKRTIRKNENQKRAIKKTEGQSLSFNKSKTQEVSTGSTESSSEGMVRELVINVPPIIRQTKEIQNKESKTTAIAKQKKRILRFNISLSKEKRTTKSFTEMVSEENLDHVSIIPPPDHDSVDPTDLNNTVQLALNGFNPWTGEIRLPQGLTTRILKSLNDEEYVVSEVVNIYFQCIQERSENNRNSLPSVHAMDDTLFLILEQGGFEDVRNATGDVDIYSKDMVIFPIVRHYHWYLVVAYMKSSKLVCFDSIRSSSNAYINDRINVLSRLIEYLSKEYEKKRGQLGSPNWALDIGHLNNIPRQKNGFDCGVFMCKFADYLATGEQPNFRPKHIPFFRRLMVQELCTRQLFR